MATTETEVGPKLETPPAVAPAVKVVPKKSDSILDKVLRLLSSVRFGIVMISILLTCCMIGMLVMQVNVDGFEKYFAHLKPAQKQIYGALGFFDIYRSRYFTLLLAITGLNIILASIDRFPAAWQYIRKPKRTASPKFIAAQMFNAEALEHSDVKSVAEKVQKSWRKLGFRGRVNEEDNRVTVFAQRNSWNRLGAYAVHVALITIFTGGFLTSRYGVGGSMEIKPGKTSNTFETNEVSLEGSRRSQAFLPFQIECTDLQQKLIRPELVQGSLDQTNTIDWLSYIRIIDRDRNHQEDMVVHLNNVGDYRGYRFFQNSFVPVGNARTITVSFEKGNGGERSTVKLRRPGTVRDSEDPAATDSAEVPGVGTTGGDLFGSVHLAATDSAEVPGVGTVKFADFFADFGVENGEPTTKSRDYNQPAAELQVVPINGEPRTMLAFTPEAADQMLGIAKGEAKEQDDNNRIVINGYKVVLRDFEKVALTHTLTIQYDPGRTPVYLGFTLLVMALCSVFFFSHQRVWAVIEPNGKGSKIYFGGNTNRNRPAFEGRFNSLVQSVTGGAKDE